MLGFPLPFPFSNWEFDSGPASSLLALVSRRGRAALPRGCGTTGDSFIIERSHGHLCPLGPRSVEGSPPLLFLPSLSHASQEPWLLSEGDGAQDLGHCPRQGARSSLLQLWLLGRAEVSPCGAPPRPAVG